MFKTRSTFEIFIIFVCMVGSTACAYLLLHPSWMYRFLNIEESDGLSQLGEVINVKPEARRRPSGQLVWFDVGQKTIIREKDRILTGETGRTQISFFGETVDIEPNSLVYFESRGDLPIINLTYGSLNLKLKNKKTFVAKSFKKEFKISAKSNFSAVKLKVEDQSLNVENISGQSNVLVGEKSFDILNNQKVSNLGVDSGQVEEAVEFLKPNQGEILWVEPNEEILIEWSGLLENLKKHTLNLNSESFLDFKRSKVIENKNSESLPIKFEGTYRASIIAENGIPIKSRTFEVLLRNPPRPLYPLSGDEILPGEKKINAAWTAKSPGAAYLIQLSDKINFEDIMSEKETSDTFASLEIKDVADHYFWRVSVISDSPVKNMWSQPQKIVVKNEKVLAKPVLDPNSKVEVADKVSVPSAAAEPISNKLSNLPAPTKVDLAADKPGPSPESQADTTPQKTEEAKVVPKPDAPPRFSQKVYNVNKSEIRVPEEFEKLNFQIKLNWKGSPLFEKYRLTASSQSNFKTKIFSTEVKKNEFLWNAESIGAEKIYLKIEGQEQDGNWMSDKKSFAGIRITKSFVLDIPKHEAPLDNTIIYSMSKNEVDPIVLSWKKVKFASSYQVEISKDPDFKNVIFSKSSKGTDLMWANDENINSLYWRVKSVHKYGSSKWSSPWSFKMASDQQ